MNSQDWSINAWLKHSCYSCQWSRHGHVGRFSTRTPKCIRDIDIQHIWQYSEHLILRDGFQAIKWLSWHHYQLCSHGPRRLYEFLYPISSVVWWGKRETSKEILTVKTSKKKVPLRATVSVSYSFAWMLANSRRSAKFLCGKEGSTTVLSPRPLI